MKLNLRWTGSGRIFIVLALSLLILNGCAGFGRRLEPPRISLVDIQLKKTTLFETTFQIELRVYNTNDVPLTIRGAECRLNLQGNDVATGVSNVRTVVPALETALVSLTVYSSVLDVVKGLLSLPGGEKLEYVLSGRVHLEGGALMPASLPFRSEGKVGLKDLKP